MSTTFTSISGEDPLMTGEEMYPISGPLINESILAKIYRDCIGLKTYWNCIEKAQIVKKHIGGVLLIGKCYILSGDYKAEFGYEFNPPLEFHAWVHIPYYGIVDVSMPGMIIKGSGMVDAYGPIIVDREPVVLAGVPEKWMVYEPNMVLNT